MNNLFNKARVVIAAAWGGGQGLSHSTVLKYPESDSQLTVCGKREVGVCGKLYGTPRLLQYVMQRHVWETWKGIGDRCRGSADASDS